MEAVRMEVTVEQRTSHDASEVGWHMLAATEM